VRDASTPHPDALVGVQKLAALNSNTATRHILDAGIITTRRVAECISIRIADILEYSDFAEEFAMQIGNYNLAILDDIKNLYLHSFGVFIELAPDEEEKQLVELWDDLDEIPEERGEYKKHYTGTIYLEEIQPTENEKWLCGVKFYDVVDGQQRLTTISIFIFELLKLADSGYSGESKEDLIKTYLCKTNSSGNSTVYKFSYAHSDKNFNFLIRNIFENKLIILQDNNLNLYTKNLTKAKEFFAEKLNDLNYEQREIIFKKLTTSLQFDIRTIEKDLDVQAVFETMNNRGMILPGFHGHSTKRLF